MRSEHTSNDVTVVGGGLAGIAAAIAAARHGASVALVQNRPVLGGNSSSEVRVWVCGATATGHQRYARENGIIGELYLENLYRNVEGNPVLWDMVLLDAVRAEPNIQLYLNTEVRSLECVGPEDSRIISSVQGWTIGSERIIRFESPIFLDCTGDGLVGYLAGARHRVGREAKSTYGEAWAPDVSDNVTLGSTILFYTKDVGRRVDYVAPDFAKDVAKTSIPVDRIIRAGDYGAAYWWIEWGGELDAVHDNEKIRDELWSVIFGIWDYIKNSGNFAADTLDLEWVGTVPGKREYRRFEGDYTLTQNDILAQTEFEDAIGFGGWSIDLHPPGGMYAPEGGAAQWYPNGVYFIPFRCLYSSNVENLLMAGRNISASHVAFGSTRVMATCAVVGEAAGTAAALCVRDGLTPRVLGSVHFSKLRLALLREDASIIGAAFEDPDDLAQVAAITATSHLDQLSMELPGSLKPLDTDVGILVPVSPRLDGLELLADVHGKETILRVEVWSTDKPQNYIPHTLESAASITLSCGERQWISVPLCWEPDIPRNAFIVIRANPTVSLHLAEEPLPGVLCFAHVPQSEDEVDRDLAEEDQPLVTWVGKGLRGRTFCFRLNAQTSAFIPAEVAGGFARPYGGPNAWSSAALDADRPERIEFTWEDAQRVSRIEIIFDDAVDEYMNNLHYHRTAYRVVPELVRDYEIEGEVNGEWRSLVTVLANRRRRRVHKLDDPVRTKCVRISILATNGSRYARVMSVRMFG